jgi:branched-chain amino acid transport system permease protein
MLFHSFLFKFYDITGGDTGIRVLRPSLLGMDFKELDKTAFLIGPFYYYCLALLAVLGLVMWRIVHSPFGLHLAALRENRARPSTWRARCASSASSPSSSPRSTAPSAA